MYYILCRLNYVDKKSSLEKLALQRDLVLRFCRANCEKEGGCLTHIFIQKILNLNELHR